MRESRFCRFFVMLAKIPRGVKELLRNDRCFQLDVFRGVENSLASRSYGAVFMMQRIIQGLVRRLEAGVSALEERPHVRRNQSVGDPVKRPFTLDIAQVERGSRVQINNLAVIGNRANALLFGGIFKGDKSHKGSRPRARRAPQKCMGRLEVLSRKAAPRSRSALR